MEVFKVSRNIAHLIILQRIELASPFLTRARRLFGRYLFSSFFSKYFINISEIGHKYYLLMQNEYKFIENFLKSGQNILSVGSGVGGLELLVSKKQSNTKVSFIEKNYISKKVKYGWDYKNLEAYNDLNLLKEFLLINHMEPKSFKIFDFDKDELPKEKFDLIISLYSLDFHYNFELYSKYFKQVSNNETIIIFDTIRPEFFKKIFEEVNIIKTDNNTLHKSKRIACRHFIN